MTHDELRKLAEAATPGTWATDYDPTASPNLWIVAPAAENPSLCKFETWDLGDGRKGQLHEQDWKDAAFIAAANPKAVLELLDRIAELEGAEKRMAERACEVVDAYSDYDAPYCCDGRMCGCEGQTVHGMMKHFILAMVKP